MTLEYKNVGLSGQIDAATNDIICSQRCSRMQSAQHSLNDCMKDAVGSSSSENTFIFPVIDQNNDKVECTKNSSFCRMYIDDGTQWPNCSEDCDVTQQSSYIHCAPDTTYWTQKAMGRWYMIDYDVVPNGSIDGYMPMVFVSNEGDMPRGEPVRESTVVSTTDETQQCFDVLYDTFYQFSNNRSRSVEDGNNLLALNHTGILSCFADWDPCTKYLERMEGEPTCRFTCGYGDLSEKEYQLGNAPSLTCRLDGEYRRWLPSTYGEVGSGEVGSGEVGSGEVGSGEVGSGEAGSGDWKIVDTLYHDNTVNRKGNGDHDFFFSPTKTDISKRGVFVSEGKISDGANGVHISKNTNVIVSTIFVTLFVLSCLLLYKIVKKRKANIPWKPYLRKDKIEQDLLPILNGEDV